MTSADGVGPGAPVAEPIAGSSRRVSYDVLRVVAICAVVGIHVFGQIPENPVNAGTGRAWVAAFLSSAFVWAVPLFVMLSGALNLDARALRGGLGAFYRRRATRIVPALVVWTLVYLVGLRILLHGERFSPTELITTLTDPTVAAQLYFLWVVLGLYLVTPIIAGFLAAGGTRRAVITAAVALGGTIADALLVGLLARHGVTRSLETNIFTAWLPYVGFYLAGYAISRLRLPRWLPFVALAAAFGCEVMVVVNKLIGIPGDVGSAVSVLAYWTSPIAVFLVGPVIDRLPWRAGARRVIARLADASFGVFLVHLLLLDLLRDLLPGLRGADSLGQALLAYAVVVVVSFTISTVAQRIPYVRSVF